MALDYAHLDEIASPDRYESSVYLSYTVGV